MIFIVSVKNKKIILNTQKLNRAFKTALSRKMKCYKMNLIFKPCLKITLNTNQSLIIIFKIDNFKKSFLCMNCYIIN